MVIFIFNCRRKFLRQKYVVLYFLKWFFFKLKESGHHHFDWRWRKNERDWRNPMVLGKVTREKCDTKSINYGNHRDFEHNHLYHYHHCDIIFPIIIKHYSMHCEGIVQNLETFNKHIIRSLTIKLLFLVNIARFAIVNKSLHLRFCSFFLTNSSGLGGGGGKFCNPWIFLEKYLSHFLILSICGVVFGVLDLCWIISKSVNRVWNLIEIYLHSMPIRI